MVDTQVLGKQATPAAYQTPDGLLDAIQAWATQLLANTIFSRLFNNNIIVTPTTELSQLTESVAPGYTDQEITTLSGPYLDPSSNAYVVSPRLLYTTTGGGGDVVYGSYLVEVTGAAATVTFTLSSGGYSAPVISSPGSGYTYTPKIIPTGATGSGAELVATITNGELTAVTITAPGTGYTTVTATVQPPVKLIYVTNFPVPLPLQTVYDAIPVVWELDELIQSV